MPNPTTLQEKLTSQDDNNEMKQFESLSQDEDLVNIADELEDEPRYHLRKRLQLEERVEANFEESEAESELVNFENTEFINPEDLQGASLDDAIDVVDGKPTPEHVDDRGETRIFGEPFKGNWWLKTEKNLPSLNRLLSIILYSNATIFDRLGKSSGHPVFLTLSNIPNRVRNLPETKILLGFLPKVQDTGIKTTENMLEADDITAIYKGAWCKMPCHTCMVLQSDLNNMSLKLENVSHRTHENIKQVINDGQGKKYFVHSVENSFWKFPNLNIYKVCIPDRMHYIDLGLFKYQLEFTQDILKAVRETELQKKFDDQLHQIPRFPGLKLLHKLGHLNVLTTSDYRNIMKIALFALDEIFEGNEITCKELCELYAKFSKMYIMSKKEMYTEKDLKIFEVSQSS
ncbi:hypothetical protein GLOIN_2v1848756 [Rhizophagus irregularis DAOM 181602=DAOM 197198]|nr:hypothetical protein GLOIN_2v1848756 [Rhizophagus irregularis DAOM 181602=DAOM 197198]